MRQTDHLVTPARLRSFFAPRGIAMVGASDNSGWARFIVAGCAATGYVGPLIPVHPRAPSAFGLPAVPSLRSVSSSSVDLAFILAPVPAVEDVLDDMAAAGIRNAIVLASGYRETGPSGADLESSLIARALSHSITLLGPNCLGFVNAHTGAAPYALSIPPPLLAGPVGIALQSGALASVVLGFARAHAIGISVLATVGNESVMRTADVLDYLIEDDATRVICLFLEEIGDPVKFGQMAEKADRAGKPIVALKAGSSPAGQRTALAHTGAVAGDDAVADAVLRQLNVIRVTSLEELLTTGALLGCHRWPRGRRMGVITASGGACDLVADAASAAGLPIPDFAPSTAAAIAPLLPSFASARNPLDVTGFDTLANLGDRTGPLTAIDRALDIAVEDPQLDFVLFAGVNLPDARPPDPRLASLLEARLDWLGARISSAPVPVIPVSATCVDVSGYGRDLLTSRGIGLVGGVELGVRALGGALRWLENRGRVRALRPVPAASLSGPAVVGAWSEASGRSLLASAGVAVVPGSLARSADEAVEVAAGLDGPAVMKICSAQIAHKSDIGGVVLGVRGEAEVRAAFEKVLAAGADAAVDGVLVTALRSGGVELLAGVTVDPAFGPVLAVGLGGIWVEVLGDTSLRLLPVTAAEVKAMLSELRGLPLLLGARGTGSASLDVLAAVIVSLGDVALALGPSLRALEVNPLWVNGDQVEALDVLVVTGGP